MKSLDELKSNEVGKCPICNGEMIDYDSMELADGDVCYYPCTCEKCGAKWNEYYTLTFLSVDNVVDSNGNTYGNNIY